LEFMKILFALGPNDVWQIQDLKTLRLDPADNSDANLYPIKDGLFLANPPFIGTIRYMMGQSIVPVVARVTGENVLRCLGTGFFVSCTGLLITAAHVIIDPIERNYGGVKALDDQTWHLGASGLGVMLPINPIGGTSGYIYREIEWAGFLAQRTEHPLPIRGIDLRLTSDTAICKVVPIAKGVPYQPLPIVQPALRGLGMAVGKTVTVLGYPTMHHVELSQVDDRTMSGDFRFDLHVSKGQILERFPDNAQTKQVFAPGACFSASAKWPGGMSGSPIFDDERIYVHGVVSTGLEDEHGVADIGYGSMLAECLALPIKPLNGKSLLDLQASGDHGIPQLKVAGA
jgi:hypothetical protein